MTAPAIADTRLARSFPWLVADIGGTNARFGWLDGNAGGVQHVRSVPVLDHADPAAAVRAYLDQLAALLGSAFRDRKSVV